MQKWPCRFDVKDLLPIGILLVVFGVVIAYGLSVMSDVREDMCPAGYTYHAGDGTCNHCSLSDGATYTYNSSDGLCHNSTTFETFVALTYGEADFNASTDSIQGVSKLPEKLPLIATVIIAAVIIGLLTRYLVVKFA